ncbi:MAG: hypothetical protein D6713_10970 [Deltaproteobacteria bacterium]|nr:MAG: hypothetical protein D6713_10970 [Deltaproteobacteria bacterium]
MVKRNFFYSFFSILILLFIGCNFPDVLKFGHKNGPEGGLKVAVVGDYYGNELATFLSSRGLAVDNFPLDPASVQTITANLSKYGIILFGDDLSRTEAITLFDAADAAGVDILGIGTEDNGTPLGSILTWEGRFGLNYAYDYDCSEMHVDVTTDGQGHPIFTGINTTTTVYFENYFGEADEQAYYVNLSDPNAPPDWTVLANLGSGMCLSGDPAIVEFTTPNGTIVILDGSANTYDGYAYWTQERWDVLYNEVVYLFEN